MRRRTGTAPRLGPDISQDAGLRRAWTAHGQELYEYALRSLRGARPAQEAVRQTFLRAWRSSDRYDPGRPLRPWLFAILRNVIIEQLRSPQGLRAPTTVSVSGPPEVGGMDGWADPLDASVDGWMVEEALRRLRADQRTVLIETYLRRRSYQDVADELGIPEPTARTRAFYGLRALRLALEEMGWEES